MITSNHRRIGGTVALTEDDDLFWIDEVERERNTCKLP
jgi:hypothetical protein